MTRWEGQRRRHVYLVIQNFGWGFILFTLAALFSSAECVNCMVPRSEFGVERREPQACLLILPLFKGNPPSSRGGHPLPCTSSCARTPILTCASVPICTAGLSARISFAKGTEMIINYENNSTCPPVADRHYRNCRAEGRAALMHELFTAATLLFA